MARPTPPFDPTPEEEGYEASRSYLKKRFATWGAEQRVELGTDAGEAPIHYKYHYVDGHLTRWSCADLDQVYLELHPAKVIVEADCCRQDWMRTDRHHSPRTVRRVCMLTRSGAG